MPTINAGKYGVLGNSSTNSFSQARNSSNANVITSNQPTSSNTLATRMRYVTGVKEVNGLYIVLFLPLM